ncbi:HEAT repeat domain-containing protein [Anabaena azotica]|uniref:HEAT repeat protein n=1 Tax=Anabaena azotica FACHB-119 TaxID=947527 RepID=A0ABR8D8A7_9NOST|nr:hypothetical protein [Anabaena azotica]MBD2503176.1 hypothetical protein [Anabaena azotica FACHB-119]
MSSIEEYEQELSEQVAAARAQSNELRRSSAPESLSARGASGLTQGDIPDGHERPLETLADPEETVENRKAAMLALKLLAISSPTFSEWRPAYLEALRIAIATPELRLAALNALVSEEDRSAQELLIKGLEDPEQALVEPADALNLLGEDPHADVRELAGKLVDQSTDERTQEAAIRNLAGDPSSVERLKAVISDKQKATNVRKQAVAALNALAPESLPVPDTERSINRRSRSADVEADVEADVDSVEEFIRILADRRRSS